MSTSAEGRRSFEQLIIEKMDSMQSSLDGKLSEFKEQILSEQRAENERLSKKLKLEKKFEFRKKGNEIQHDFQEKIKATMEETASLLENDGNIPKVKEALQQGINEVNERQKLIKIADRSKNGWLTAQEYQADDLTTIRYVYIHTYIIKLSFIVIVGFSSRVNREFSISLDRQTIDGQNYFLNPAA